MREIIIHCYPEGCGFNVAIRVDGRDIWQSRTPMNAWQARQWAQRHTVVGFTGNVAEAQAIADEAA